MLRAACSRLLRTEVIVRFLLGVGSAARIVAAEVVDEFSVRSEMAFRELRALRLRVDGPRGVFSRVGVALTRAIAGFCGACWAIGAGSRGWDSRWDSRSGEISGAGRLRDAGSSPNGCCGVGVDGCGASYCMWRLDDGATLCRVGRTRVPNGDERKPNARRRRFGRGVFSTGRGVSIAAVTVTGLICAGGVGDFRGDDMASKRKAALSICKEVATGEFATGDGARLPSREWAMLLSREAAMRLLRRGCCGRAIWVGFSVCCLLGGSCNG